MAGTWISIKLASDVSGEAGLAHPFASPDQHPARPISVWFPRLHQLLLQPSKQPRWPNVQQVLGLRVCPGEFECTLGICLLDMRLQLLAKIW